MDNKSNLRLPNRHLLLKGFTLVELLVAVSILSIGIVFILRSFLTIVSALDLTSNEIMAMQFLGTKIDALEQGAKEDGGIDSQQEKGTFNLGSRNAEWELKVITLAPDQTEEEEQDKEQQQINEVSLTLFWQQTGQKKNVNVITYIPLKQEEEKLEEPEEE